MCNTSSASSDSFTSSFPIWMPFSSCFCLIALASAFNTMLNESGKSEHTCLFHDLEYDVNSRLVIYGLYYVEVISLSTHFIGSFFFLSYIDIEFCQMIFLHLLR